MSTRKPRPKNRVYVRLLYDAFAPKTAETHELVWRKNATIGDYLDGLPMDCEWLVFLNGIEVKLDAVRHETLEREELLGLIMVPQGGDGFKSILRVVMQVAALAVNFIPGLGTIASIAIMAGLSLASAFLLAPKAPKSSNSDDSPSYGIDGAKNSATEGIPYPVVYGEYRTAGNFSDCYTVNVGDDQYLYVRAVMNDGEIYGISNVEINEQPLTTFTAAEARYALGTLTQGVNDWFTNSTVQVNKSVKIETGGVTHITTSAVDKIRWDVGFTQGLVSIDAKKGTYKSKSVTFQMSVRELNPVTGSPVSGWTPVQTTAPSSVPVDLNGDGVISFVEIQAARIYASNPALQAQLAQQQQQVGAARGTASLKTPGGSQNIVYQEADILWREQGGDWASLGGFSGGGGGSYDFDPSGDGSIVGDTNITPMVNGVFNLNPYGGGGNYEIMPVGGAVITAVQTYPTSANFTVTVTDSRTKVLRRSFETERLKKGVYEATIRRLTATSTDQYQIDEVYLSDVAEIEVDPVAQRGTASLSLRIKLNEQLNAIPQLTALVKGSIVQFYDIEGNPTTRGWTNNPAWIGLDILCGRERGAGFPLRRIDWPRWLDFADYCTANNIQFNGVFDTGTNLGDALQQVLRIGHAAPVPFGTRLSVAVDCPRAPVTTFTQARILKDSFEIGYVGVTDRANEFEFTYYDKTDRNKEKTIRYVDPKAVTFNELPRKASVTLMGVDNHTQASAEMWRSIYSNRLLMRTISFDAWMDAIDMAMGEVALIQHNQMQWANSGLLKAGSTTTSINLDQPVTIEAGKNYSVLVMFDAIKTGERAYSSLTNRRLMVTGAPIASLKAKRVIVDGQDFEIASMTDGAQFHTITLASAPLVPFTRGAVVQLWDTDVPIETIVTTPPGTTDTVTIGTPLPQAPGALAGFIFGEMKDVRKPFTLTGINGSGLEKRKLTFMEYHEGIYGPPEIEIPIPVKAITDRDVAQVQQLLFEYERLVEANRKTINVRVSWSPGGIRNYAGADIYMRVNGGTMSAIGSAANVSEYMIQANPGDDIEFKVAAYNTRGDRAAFDVAPSVRGTCAVIFSTLDPPTNLEVEIVNFQVDGKAQLSWTPPADPTGVTYYEGRYRRKTDSTWTGLGLFASNVATIAGLQTGTYVSQVRAISDTSFSPWIEKEFPVAVAPGSLMANFLASNNRNKTPIPAPTTTPVTDVQHSLNTDGSADISFQWGWVGDDATIDGFEVVWENVP